MATWGRPSPPASRSRSAARDGCPATAGATAGATSLATAGEASLATAGATTMAVAATTTTVTAPAQTQHGGEFLSPSGNISCEIDNGYIDLHQVYCQTISPPSPLSWCAPGPSKSVRASSASGTRRSIPRCSPTGTRRAPGRSTACPLPQALPARSPARASDLQGGDQGGTHSHFQLAAPHNSVLRYARWNGASPSTARGGYPAK